MTRYILSSVGTSLLTNNAGSLTTLLRDTANLREAELSAEQRHALDERIAAVRDLLSAADLALRRRCSAELNGLHGLCGQRLVADDLHFLLATDTYQGRAAGGLLRDYLEGQGVSSVQVVVPERLSTRSQADFTAGIRAVIRFCEDTFGTCREARVPVLFNLVGSFKSLQGYLNTIGMFYADEILYVFEDPAAELIRIPRLPIRLDLSLLRENRVLCSMLYEGYELGWGVPPGQVTDWPETLHEPLSAGLETLSTWGLLLWERGREELLGEELLDLPRLVITESFRRDWNARRANRRERLELQQRLARVAVMLDQSNGDTSPLKRDGSLQYDNYAGANAGIGHFRVNNRGWRVTCTTEGGELRLRRFGPHEINNNP